MNRILRILMLLVAVAVTIPAGAQIIKRKNLVDINRDSIEHVIIDGDTVPVILPEKNYGRFDRGLFNYIFIPKGKWGFGITANYGELQTEDIQVLSILKMLISMARCILSSHMCRILCVATSRLA